MVGKHSIQTAFPSSHLIPKEEIRALDFLIEHPEYDGRGVVVAVFDTGVDPGAAHLQVTTDGKAKIVDIIDTTGSGDVCTKTIRKQEDGTIELLSGRTITIPGTWECPSGEFRVGMKRAYELYPSTLVKRLKDENRKRWDQEHRETMSALEQCMVDFDAKHGKDGAKHTPEEKKERQDIADRKEVLAGIHAAYDDPGPIVDAIVFHDGARFQACVLTEGQAVETAKVMTDYHVKQQYGTFGEADMCNYTFNIYDNGDVLSIHVPSGAHGTHVCGILAAHNPSKCVSVAYLPMMPCCLPAMNGVAPGAQIVSVKIGDTRLDSLETANALVRALVATAVQKCDIINMSYGEDVQVPNVGNFTDLANEIVNKHGVIYVSSAGNSGPALSTVTAPGGTTSALISVGAYVTEPLMDVGYTMRELPPANSYTWSSRGPCTNGNYGVTICAPGGAITSVPNYTLKGSQLMNGTSMASPNACGGIALVLSGLKAQNIAYSPHRIKRALENTAFKLGHVAPFSQGHGMLQVKDAFDHVVKHGEYQYLDVDYVVNVPSLGAGAQGIYLRESFHTNRPQEIVVKVDPVFHEKANNDLRIGFEAHIRLKCTAKWVRAPNHMVLMHDGREFGVLVDPTFKTLTPGAHFTEISGYDANKPEAGPLFNIPITVIVPEKGQVNDEDLGSLNYTFKDMAYTPAHIERKFLNVPVGATWAELRLTATDMESGDRKIVVHAQQLDVHRGHSKNEYHTTVTLDEGAPSVRIFNVTGGRTLELCLAQFWSSLGTCVLSADINFHGLKPDHETVHVRAAGDVQRVDVTSMLRAETLLPVISLNAVHTHIRPTTAAIAPLTKPYDTIPNKRPVYDLVLEYNFSQPEAGDVTPMFPALNHVLYESAYQGQTCVITDTNKKIIYWGDMFPKKAKLEKGDYTLRIQVASDRMELLEKQKDMMLTLARSISEVKLDAYPSFNAAVSNGPKFSETKVRRGAKCPVFFTGPPADKVPSWAKVGDEMVGTVSLAKLPNTATGNGKPKGFLFVAHIGAPANKEKEKTANESAAADLSEWQKFENQLRDHKIAALPKLYADSTMMQAQTIFEELRIQHAEHLPVFSSWLKAMDGGADKRGPVLAKEDCRTTDLACKVVQAADTVIDMIDLVQLAAHFGVKVDEGDKALMEKRADMKKQKEALLDALNRKGRALVELILLGETTAYNTEEFANVLRLLHQWSDEKDNNYQVLLLHDHLSCGRLGSAAKGDQTPCNNLHVDIKLLIRAILHIAGKYLSSAETGDAKKRMQQWYATVLLGALGWAHCSTYYRQMRYKDYPVDIPLF